VFSLRCGPYSVASVCARLLVLLPALLLSTPSTALTQRATPVWNRRLARTCQISNQGARTW
jgi:hypothetical protein